jgi:branched-chain amino acid transport system substrate-binding protein
MDYKNKFESRFNSPVSTFGGHAYDAFMIFKSAYASDRKNLANAIENVRDYIGTYGVFNYSESDHNGLTKDAFVLVEIKNGDWELIR